MRDSIAGALRFLILGGLAAVGMLSMPQAGPIPGSDGSFHAAPQNLPHWRTWYAKRFPDCVAFDPNLRAETLLVVRLDASVGRMPIGIYLERESTPIDADDVWIVGSCGVKVTQRPSRPSSPTNAPSGSRPL